MSRYLDGELPAPEQRLLEEHLAQCPQCAGEFARLRGIDSLLRADAPPPPPPDLTRRIMLRVERERETNNRWAWLQDWVAWPRPMRFAMAGSAALAVIIGLLISGAGSPRTPASDVAWLVAASRGPIVSAYQGVKR